MTHLTISVVITETFWSFRALFAGCFCSNQQRRMWVLLSGSETFVVTLTTKLLIMISCSK